MENQHKPLWVNGRQVYKVRIVKGVGLSICVNNRSRKQGGAKYVVVPLSEIARQVGRDK